MVLGHNVVIKFFIFDFHRFRLFSMAEQSFQKTNYEEVSSDRPKLKIGQEFESIDEASYFYNEVYAKVVGFSVRMGSSKKVC